MQPSITSFAIFALLHIGICSKIPDGKSLIEILKPNGEELLKWSVLSYQTDDEVILNEDGSEEYVTIKPKFIKTKPSIHLEEQIKHTSEDVAKEHQKDPHQKNELKRKPDQIIFKDYQSPTENAASKGHQENQDQIERKGTHPIILKDHFVQTDEDSSKEGHKISDHSSEHREFRAHLLKLLEETENLKKSLKALKDAEQINKEPENTEQINEEPQNAEQINKEPENAEQINMEPENAEQINKEPENTEQINKEPENTENIDSSDLKEHEEAQHESSESQNAAEVTESPSIVATIAEEPLNNTTGKPNIPFDPKNPKFVDIKTNLKEKIRKVMPKCPELHGRRLYKAWISQFTSAWPNFSDMLHISTIYADDLRLQLSLCAQHILKKKFGVGGHKDSQKSGGSTIDEVDTDSSENEHLKPKRELDNQEAFLSDFNKELKDPLVNMFSNMGQLIDSVRSD